MFISPYSYRASACLSLSMIWKILSFNFSSLSWAFSAEISSCFMFSPTVSNSCSPSFNFCSANSARSLALLSSSSWTPNFLVNSSSFCSLSLAILEVSLKLNFVPHGLVLKVFDFLQDTISFLGSHGQFGNGLSQIAVSLLGFLLHQHDSPGQGANFLLSVLESLFLLLKGSEGFDKLVIGLIKVTLVVLDLLAHVTNVTFISITLTIGLFGFSLEFGNGGHEIVSLRLERLHLFPNGIHVCS